MNTCHAIIAVFPFIAHLTAAVCDKVQPHEGGELCCINTLTSASDAATVCSNEGNYRVISIETENEWETIKSYSSFFSGLVGERYFIGLTRPSESASWKWSSGVDFIWDVWKTQPSSTNEFALADISSHGAGNFHKWHGITASDQAAVVCEPGQDAILGDINADDCVGVTCENLGTCLDGDSDYSCSCVDGFTGQLCEENLNDCDGIECENVGICEDGINSYTCNCVVGFTGEHCEVNIDDCNGITCYNSGTCIDGVNSYTCNCVTGFGGTHCEENIDDCNGITCHNSGSCIDGVNSYTCNCVTGFGGTHCEENIDECNGITCYNSGTCIDGVNSYTCNCVTGFNGTHCEENIDDCNGITCHNSGTCIDGINSYTCNCVTGFSGTHCEENIDDCNGITCHNSGSCIDGVNSYTCNCVTGFGGTHCEENIDDCNGITCHNSGSCIDGVNSYTCNCVTGFGGTHCEENIDECNGITCYNSGTCIDGVNSYTCNCVTGFNGTHCEENIDDCNGITCHNSGTCIDGINSYTCNCVTGFSGTHCEENIDDCDGITCENSGTCEDGISNYTCNCFAGFNGTHCEINIDDCDGMTCHNSGTCVDGTNTYSCTCATGFTGTVCADSVITTQSEQELTTADHDVITTPNESVTSITSDLTFDTIPSNEVAGSTNVNTIVTSATSSVTTENSGTITIHNLNLLPTTPESTEITTEDQIHLLTPENPAIEQTNPTTTENPIVKQTNSITTKKSTVEQTNPKTAENTIVEQTNSITTEKSTVEQTNPKTTENTIVEQTNSITTEKSTVEQTNPKTTKNTIVEQTNSITTEKSTVEETNPKTTVSTIVDQTNSITTEKFTVEQTDVIITANPTAVQTISITTEIPLVEQTNSITTEEFTVEQTNVVNTASTTAAETIAVTSKTVESITKASDYATTASLPLTSVMRDYTSGLTNTNVPSHSSTSGSEVNGETQSVSEEKTITLIISTTSSSADGSSISESVTSTDISAVFSTEETHSAITTALVSDRSVEESVEPTTMQMLEMAVDIPSYLPCSDAPVVDHSYVRYSETSDGVFLMYTCQEDCEFPDKSVELTIQCNLATGQWSQQPQTCTKKQCPELPLVEHSHRSSDDITVGSLVTFTCEIGFEWPDGLITHSIHCRKDQTWTQTIPHCQARSCTAVDVLPSQSEPVVRQSGDLLSMGCDSGVFTAVGSPQLQTECSSRGVWSEEPTQCASVNCLPPPYIENAELSGQQSMTGSVLTVTCLPGYRFPDGRRTKTMSCLGDTWSAVYNKCLVITCPPVPQVNDSMANTDLAIYGTVVVYECDYGYRFPDNHSENTIICEESGDWSKIPPHCQEVWCKSAPPLENSIVLLPNDTSVGQHLTYTCEHGHRFLDGTEVKNRTCSLSGNWTSLDSHCQEDRCPPLEVPPHIVKSSTATSQNLSVHLTPETGYRFTHHSNSVVMHCGSELVWLGDLPETQEVRCPVLNNSVLEVSTSDQNMTYNSTVTISCAEGHRFTDGERHRNITCKETGNWSDTNHSRLCHAVECWNPPKLGNATVDKSTASYGDHVTYTCRTGHTFQESRSKTKQASCRDDSGWEIELVGCTLVHCHPVPVWLFLQVNTSGTVYRTVIQYSCTENAVFQDGSKDPFKTAHCDMEGQWQPIITSCNDDPDTGRVSSPPTEAEGATNIGIIASVIVGIPLFLILLLDLMTSCDQLEKLQLNLTHGWLNCKEKLAHFRQTQGTSHGHRKSISPSIISLETACNATNQMEPSDLETIIGMHKLPRQALAARNTNKLLYYDPYRSKSLVRGNLHACRLYKEPQHAVTVSESSGEG